jgi:L-rhamnose mutarotase
MKRFGWIIGVRSEKLDEYKRLHAAAWPGVLRMIKECHIQNYSIYVRQLPDGNHYLFSYLEYVGSDFAADMAKMAADEETQRWWAVCKPCQNPLANRKSDEWWSDMEEVFHLD